MRLIENSTVKDSPVGWADVVQASGDWFDGPRREWPRTLGEIHSEFLRSRIGAANIGNYDSLPQLPSPEDRTSMLTLEGQERRIFNSFVKLVSSDARAIKEFSSKYGPWLAVPPEVYVGTDPLWYSLRREPMELWQWHLKRLQLVLKLNELRRNTFLGETPSERFRREVLRLFDEYPPTPIPFSRTLVPWRSFRGHKNLFCQAPPFTLSEKDPVNYCPEQEGLWRPTHNDRSVKSLAAFAQSVVDHLISSTLDATTAIRVEIATGNTFFEPKSLLGIIYTQLLSHISRARLSSRKTCAQCGRQFLPTRIDQRWCGERCRKRDSYVANRTKRDGT